VAPLVGQWEIRKDHVTWRCDLRFHGESYAWEAMILRDGDLAISQRFDGYRSAETMPPLDKFVIHYRVLQEFFT
jgi:hypothetical protein